MINRWAKNNDGFDARIIRACPKFTTAMRLMAKAVICSEFSSQSQIRATMGGSANYPIRNNARADDFRFRMSWMVRSFCVPASKLRWEKG